VQDFVLRRLIIRRGASAGAVEGHRDAFELPFSYLEKRTGTSPSALQMADLDASLLLDFLDRFESDRGKRGLYSQRALGRAPHSFMRYAAVHDVFLDPSDCGASV
jgi:integrase/recombinase XerD